MAEHSSGQYGYEPLVDNQSEEITQARAAMEAVRYLENDDALEDFCGIIDLEYRDRYGEHSFDREQIKHTALIETFLIACEQQEACGESWNQTPYDLIADRTMDTLNNTGEFTRDYMRDPAPVKWQTVYNYTIPDTEEQNQLIEQAQSGDKEAEAKVVASCLRFVHARYIRGRMEDRPVSEQLRGIVSVHDIAQEAAIVLLKRIKGYKPEYGFRFLTYARQGMDRSVSRAFNYGASTIRIPTDVLGRTRTAMALAEYENHQPGSQEDLYTATINELVTLDKESSKYTVLSCEQSYWQWILAARSNFMHAGAQRVELEDVMDYAPSSDAFLAEDSQGEPIELSSEHWLESRGDYHDQALIEQDADEYPVPISAEVPMDTNETVDYLVSYLPALREAAKRLSVREKNILARRYGLWDDCPKTLQELGSSLDLSRERVRQIEKGAIYKLLGSKALRPYRESLLELTYDTEPKDQDSPPPPEHDKITGSDEAFPE